MELNKKQKQGLDIAVDRYFRGERYTVIAGYAGTGKSTLVKFIISALGVRDEDVVYTVHLYTKGNKFAGAAIVHKDEYYAKYIK